jgi:hypothetical protein
MNHNQSNRVVTYAARVYNNDSSNQQSHHVTSTPGAHHQSTMNHNQSNRVVTSASRVYNNDSSNQQSHHVTSTPGAHHQSTMSHNGDIVHTKYEEPQQSNHITSTSNQHHQSTMSHNGDIVHTKYEEPQQSNHITSTPNQHHQSTMSHNGDVYNRSNMQPISSHHVTSTPNQHHQSTVTYGKYPSAPIDYDMRSVSVMMGKSKSYISLRARAFDNRITVGEFEDMDVMAVYDIYGNNVDFEYIVPARRGHVTVGNGNIIQGLVHVDKNNNVRVTDDSGVEYFLPNAVSVKYIDVSYPFIRISSRGCRRMLDSPYPGARSPRRSNLPDERVTGPYTVVMQIDLKWKAVTKILDDCVDVFALIDSHDSNVHWDGYADDVVIMDYDIPPMKLSDLEINSLDGLSYRLGPMNIKGQKWHHLYSAKAALETIYIVYLENVGSKMPFDYHLAITPHNDIPPGDLYLEGKNYNHHKYEDFDGIIGGTTVHIDMGKLPTLTYGVDCENPRTLKLDERIYDRKGKLHVIWNVDGEYLGPRKRTVGHNRPRPVHYEGAGLYNYEHHIHTVHNKYNTALCPISYHDTHPEADVIEGGRVEWHYRILRLAVERKDMLFKIDSVCK